MAVNDLVNSPAHYTQGRYEAIDVIEDAISCAPDAVVGNCQGHVLRYVLRLWDKGDPVLNAKKARWYLDRLISHQESKKVPTLQLQQDLPQNFDDPLQ
ncbi:DUF3310 domain-containing protein [Limnobacter sp.]|uniref:DUF3310 domain-containing protein n=1 Tax=Limnobacter sp. TaxID=2003368 RepID=UPI0025BAAF32|nr:DUF3310 domain-containing protein [Limnobacter sp.]